MGGYRGVRRRNMRALGLKERMKNVEGLHKGY
jgi:hypothetical protein